MLKSYQEEKLLSKVYRIVIRETLFPLFLIVSTVTSAVVIPYIVIHKNSFTRDIPSIGITTLVQDAWRAVNWRDREVWGIVTAAAGWATLSLLLPGSPYH